MVGVVRWQFQYHLHFLLAELCSKLGSQVEENILFSILFFQKATQKRPRAKGSNDLRMRYKDYCEYSEVFTYALHSPGYRADEKLEPVKESVVSLVVETSAFFPERGASQEQQSFMQTVC